MTATNHATTGALIAVVIKKPELAVPLAFVSHFIIDMIPHFEARDLSDKSSKLFIYSDATLAALLAIVYAFAFSVNVPAWLIFACATAAVSPDFMWAFRYLRLKDMDKVFEEPMPWIARLHLDIQFSETLQGIIVEAVWFITMLILLIKLSLR